MEQEDVPIPTAHVDDEHSTGELAETLTEIHGCPYECAFERWETQTVL